MRAAALALYYPTQAQVKKNRMLMLLKWDLYAAIFCVGLFVFMMACALHNSEQLRPDAADEPLGTSAAHVARTMTLGIVTGELWSSWQCQARAPARRARTREALIGADRRGVRQVTFSVI